MTGFTVISPGVLSLLQDNGRLGQAALGLTTGGPMDAPSAAWANRLLGNPPNTTLVECSVGGLQLQANINSYIAVTGAVLNVSINGKAAEQWTVHKVQQGDVIELGMVSQGLRAYLAVAGGFNITAQFGSSATVLREKIGGLNGNKLQPNDLLPCQAVNSLPTYQLPGAHRPRFNNIITLRLVEGYQVDSFSNTERQRFYLNSYTVTSQADRMGYKLSGSAIQCQQSQLLSEGICYGAVQIPPDGQPIVLLNDRQTLGGYPKIGAVLSLDCALLAQAPAGTRVYFTPISPQHAHNALCLAKVYTDAIAGQLVSV
ncbi:biotin-dependent carboxyltransferase family protein [Arsukibacterium indicum]|uniref:Biotin-dependent carboxyltransferase family protein n=1 Tax=Arsukibacterium indicum TaxID=2848612 RepID=A0ABS6MPU1_9GAMM|nr:biotin-dependent carboxyltransferase family protein [Arsukibacterium indicum]MBV2130590.1 biotin-dependent carboxyltransferase family protein [Arsukibacterium indicum]